MSMRRPHETAHRAASARTAPTGCLADDRSLETPHRPARALPRTLRTPLHAARARPTAVRRALGPGRDRAGVHGLAGGAAPGGGRARDRIARRPQLRDP